MNIQHLIQEAKDTMLSSGTIIPMLHLQLEKHYIGMILDVLNEHQSIPAQLGRLARIVWEECQKHPDEKLIAVGFYAEAWIGTSSKTEMRLNPVSDPERREIIAVEVWEGGTSSYYQMDILRDSENKVIAVGEPIEHKARRSLQMEAILRGYHDSKRPPEDVLREMEDELTKLVATLTPKQKHAFDKFRQEL